MRKVLICLAAAGGALTAAAPAAAQYHAPQPYGHGYNDYDRERGSRLVQLQVLQSRVDQLQRQIDQAVRYRTLGYSTANRLRAETIGIERQLRSAGGYGLNPYQVNNLQARIARLVQRVGHASGNARRYGNYNGYNGYNGYNVDGPLGDGVDDENN